VTAASKALAIQESFRMLMGSSRKMVGAQGSAKVGNADTASSGAGEESEVAQTFAAPSAPFRLAEIRKGDRVTL
jgi:hypothetical protein